MQNVVTLNFCPRRNLPLRRKFETKVWSETEDNLGNPVSDQTTVMHLDRQLSLIP